MHWDKPKPNLCAKAHGMSSCLHCATTQTKQVVLIPPVVRRASLRHRGTYFELQTKREGTLASFDAQASSTRVATRLAPPTPCSPAASRSQYGVGVMRCRLAVSMKSGGAVLAPGGLQQFGGNQKEGGSSILQAFVNGRLRLRDYLKTNFPYVTATLPGSTLPHSHARAMRAYACLCTSIACLWWSVGRLAV